jgi:hypothetical protein
VTVPPPALNPSMTFTLAVSVSGHFIRPKGKLVLGKTVALVGTFSAPDICAVGTLATYSSVFG